MVSRMKIYKNYRLFRRINIMITSISKEEAIKVMENNLKLLKEYSDSDTFLLVSYDLENEKSLGRRRLNLEKGKIRIEGIILLNITQKLLT
jgi:ABC-type polysaccharide/polyol phosphate transport system ATPase subunit